MILVYLFPSLSYLPYIEVPGDDLNLLMYICPFPLIRGLISYLSGPG
jgi:hypothetical protein